MINNITIYVTPSHFFLMMPIDIFRVLYMKGDFPHIEIQQGSYAVISVGDINSKGSTFVDSSD